MTDLTLKMDRVRNMRSNWFKVRDDSICLTGKEMILYKMLYCLNILRGGLIISTNINAKVNKWCYN